MTHPKSALNAYCQSKGLPLPKFETRGTGTEDDPLFISDVSLEGDLLATGQGRSKREAEKVAAELALELLKRTHGEPQTKNRKRRRKSRGGGSGEAVASPESEAAAPAEASGGWPIYPEVLAEALRIADARLPASVKGRDVREELARFAGDIYKTLLEDLGLTS
ncbi:putative dsRNA-binding protein [Oceanithermus sp.]